MEYIVYREFNNSMTMNDALLKDSVLNSRYNGLTYYSGKFVFSFKEDITGAEQAYLTSLVNSVNDVPVPKEVVKEKISTCIAFGQAMFKEFSSENSLMGIAQEGKTRYVLKKSQMLLMALQTGLISDCISMLENPQDEDYITTDEKYFTNTRKALYASKCREFLSTL